MLRALVLELVLTFALELALALALTPAQLVLVQVRVLVLVLVLSTKYLVPVLVLQNLYGGTRDLIIRVKSLPITQGGW